MKTGDSRTPYAKKSFGQNFLVDKNYIDRIIRAIDLTSLDTVVEIGPGRGALTEWLIQKAGQVIAIELDRDLIPHLQERFGFKPHFHLIEQDALSIDFRDLLAADTAGPTTSSDPASKIKLVANLPYYISTAILQRLIEQRNVFSEMVLMFQREVVERMIAKPGDSERGFLTVLVEAFLIVEKLFEVPPAAFRPAPKVWSAVVRLRPKETDVRDEDLLRQVFSLAFAQKRKTILNNLKAHYADAAELLESAGIDPKRRAESLTLAEWLSLLSNIAGSNDSRFRNIRD